MIRRRIFYVFVAVLLSLIFTITCCSVFLRIKNVEFTGSGSYDPAELFEESGITRGDNMYSTSTAELSERLIPRFPYIKKLELKRHLPSTAQIDITMDEPLYIVNVYEEYFVLSSTLRVLARSEDRSALDPGLIELAVPTVNYAFAGKPVIFENKSYFDFAVSYLSELEHSEMFRKITAVDITDRYNTVVVYDGRFTISFGSDIDLGTKLVFANKILTEHFTDSDKGRLNVRDVEAAYAVLD